VLIETPKIEELIEDVKSGRFKYRLAEREGFER
jgi:hypothetical protein